MKNILLAGVVVLSGLFSAGSQAAPGEYWEVTTKMEMQGMPFAMPATTQKICIGKGDEKDPRQSSKDKECEMTDVKFSGNKTSWKVRCNHDGEVMTGSGEQTTSADGYQGKMHFSGKSGGRNMDMTNVYSGKRLGGACDTGEMMNKIKGEACDTSNLRSTGDWIGYSGMVLEKDALCASNKARLCELVRKDAPSDADTYSALVQHDKAPGVQVAKACGLNMAATTKSICKTLNGKNYRTLSSYCPAEAKTYLETARKKECEGRSYTAHEDLSKCLSGQDGGDDMNAADDEVPPKDAAGKSKSDTLIDGAKKLDGESVLEGAKKLKGLFGF